MSERLAVTFVHCGPLVGLKRTTATLMNPTWYISLRALLRGSGTSLALPLLEAMLPPGAQPQRAPRVRRFLPIWMFPTGTAGRFDSVQNCRTPPWTPAETGPLTTPNEFLRPFFDANVQEKITVLTGVIDRAVCGEH